MNLLFAILMFGDVSIKQLPTVTLTNGALVHTVGANSQAGVRISNPQPMSRSINLWFPAVQTDETAPAITYSIDWTQPNGSKALPENLRWNAFNVGDLYWQPSNVHVGLHQFTVTATSGMQSAVTTFKINVLASTITPVPIPGPTGTIKAYNYVTSGSNTAMIATTSTGVSEPYLSWLVYPATHCVWYADISGSGGSYSAGDYGINYIGQTGGARSAAWILTPNGVNQFNALVNYSMLSRANHYIAWPSQTPSFGSPGAWGIATGWNRYVADTNAVVGAGEGRYQATYAFRDAFYRLFNGLNPDLRRRIVTAGHFIPTYQVALRRSQSAATGYLDDPKAHPTVFTSTTTTTDLAKVDTFATMLNSANVLLPICTVSVLSEDWKLPLEDLHSVDRSIARTWYGMDRERHMRIDARQSFVPNGVLKQVHWKVLETGGGSDSIEITPLNQQGTVADLIIRYPKGNQPIKVGVFAEADSNQSEVVRFSAPAFLTFSPWSDLDEARGPDIDNGVAKDGIPLTGYDGYNIYDKREYRVYDAAGKLLKRSSGGRAQLWRRYISLTNTGLHTEDVFSYDAAGVMTGFQRLYANSFSTFGFPYTSDGVRIIAKDSQGRPTLAEFQKQVIGLPERAVARVAFDYPTGQRRTARIDHLTYTPDPAHTTDRRYDVASVSYVNTFNGDIQLSRGTSPTTIEGTARFSPGMIDGYKIGSTTPDFSTAWNGEFETLADALQIVSANIMKPPVIGVTIIPADVPSLAAGSTIKLVAKVTGIPNATVSWSVYSSPVVPSIGAITVSQDGLVTAVKAGTDYAVASVANGPQVIQAFCRVVVVGTPQPPPPPVVTTIVVSPTTATIEAGKTVQLSATIKDQYGNTMTGVAVVWSTSNPGFATVSSSGLATGVAAGPATITASAGGKAGMAIITVMPETRILTKAEVQQLLGQGLQRTIIDIIVQQDGTYKLTLGN